MKFFGRFDYEAKTEAETFEDEFNDELTIRHYDTLEVALCADFEMVKKTYRLLAMKYHPDRNNGQTEKQFTDIQDAYDYLDKYQTEIKENKEVILANEPALRLKMAENKKKEAMRQRTQEAGRQWGIEAEKLRQETLNQSKKRHLQEEEKQAWEKKTREWKEEVRKNDPPEVALTQSDKNLEEWQKKVQQLRQERRKLYEEEINLRLKGLDQLKRKLDQRKKEMAMWELEKSDRKEKLVLRAQLDEKSAALFKTALVEFEKEAIEQNTIIQKLDEQEAQLWNEELLLRKEETRQQKEVTELDRLENEITLREKETRQMRKIRIRLDENDIRFHKKDIHQWKKEIDKGEQEILERDKEIRSHAEKMQKSNANEMTASNPPAFYVPFYNNKAASEEKPQNINKPTTKKNKNPKEKLLSFCTIL